MTKELFYLAVENKANYKRKGKTTTAKISEVKAGRQQHSLRDL